MNKWTQQIDIFDIVYTDKAGKNVLEVKAGHSDEIVYLKKAMVDSDEPEDIVKWIRSENFNDVDMAVFTEDNQSVLVLTFYDINDALRFKTSFGTCVVTIAE